MPIDFPDTPVLNEEYSAAGTTWVWDGQKWLIKESLGPVGPTGPTGPIFQNVDAGTPTSVYGGVTPIDCGGVLG